jgi:hypothetical protein
MTVTTLSTEDWLRRLKWALASMPSPEREDILAETRAHLEERLASGATAQGALAPFGAPESYAAQFLEDMELAGVLARPRLPQLLGTIARRAHKSLVAAIAFLLVLFVGGTVLGVCATAIWKLGDPSHAGLWIGGGNFFFGTVDDPTPMREVLGNWIYPLALVSLGLGWMLCRLLLIWAVRTLKRRA